MVLAALLALPAGVARADLKDVIGGFSGGKNARVVLVFVDLTQSVRDSDIERIYTPTLRSLNDALQPGDRFVLAEISEQTLGSFTPHLDLEMPRTGRSMEDNDALDAGKQRIRDQWRKLLGRKGKAKATVILDSLNAGSQILSRDARPRKQIVILSDMVEESKSANFAKSLPTPASTDTLISERRAKGLLPDLRGAQVYVAGASAPTGEAYVQIQNFWLRYVQAAGGQISEKTYGRVALGAF
jgi:hypothetical protein